jgi:hypothetical protein
VANLKSSIKESTFIFSYSVVFLVFTILILDPKIYFFNILILVFEKKNRKLSKYCEGEIKFMNSYFLATSLCSLYSHVLFDEESLMVVIFSINLLKKVDWA